MKTIAFADILLSPVHLFIVVRVLLQVFFFRLLLLGLWLRRLLIVRFLIVGLLFFGLLCCWSCRFGSFGVAKKPGNRLAFLCAYVN
jgi:hypothetical protein